MIDQTLVVDKILSELKAAKIATSTVEKEIGVAAGYLWKVKKGRKHLLPENLKLLQDYRDKYCAPKTESIKPVLITIPPPHKNITATQTPRTIDITTTPVKKGSLASFLGPRPNLVKFSKKIR